MRTLVIDCATENCSAALFEDGSDGLHLIDGYCETLGRGHAERLVPMIGQLPDAGRAARIAVSTGPGSFTGIRVGLAAAKALALAWDAQLLGYPTLALIAAQARLVSQDSPVGVVTNAGHGEWFVQSFGTDGLPEGDAQSLPPRDAVISLTAPIVAGNRADAFVEALGHGRALSILPDARAFGRLSASMLSPEPRPVYGRRPDAALPGDKATARRREPVSNTQINSTQADTTRAG